MQRSPSARDADDARRDLVSRASAGVHARHERARASTCSRPATSRWCTSIAAGRSPITVPDSSWSIRCSICGALRLGVRELVDGDRARDHRDARELGHRRAVAAATRRASTSMGASSRASGCGSAAAAAITGSRSTSRMDLEPFRRINPCGYAGLEVTDLGDARRTSGLRDVARALAPRLLAELGLEGATGPSQSATSTRWQELSRDIRRRAVRGSPPDCHGNAEITPGAARALLDSGSASIPAKCATTIPTTRLRKSASALPITLIGKSVGNSSSVGVAHGRR